MAKTGDLEVPEWLPDWRDETSYQFPNIDDREAWAWEFLRRNSEYQRAWHEQYVDGPLRSAAPDGSPSSVAQRLVNYGRRKYGADFDDDPVVDSYTLWVKRDHECTNDERGRQLCRLFGLGSRHLVDPAISMVTSSPFIRSLVMFETSAAPAMVRPYSSRGGELSARGPHDMLMRIDLRLPIEPQMKRAKEVLSSVRKRLAEDGKIELYSGGVQIEKFPQYLRFLDAVLLERPKENSDEFAKIAEEILRMEDEYPDRIAYNTGRRSLIKAREFRDNLYREIPLRGG